MPVCPRTYIFLAVPADCRLSPSVCSASAATLITYTQATPQRHIEYDHFERPEGFQGGGNAPSLPP